MKAQIQHGREGDECTALLGDLKSITVRLVLELPVQKFFTDVILEGLSESLQTLYS